MFNVEQRGLTSAESDVSVAPVVISLLNTYAGLSTAVSGFVLDKTALVIGGLVLVGSASMLIRLPRSNRTRKGEKCESLHPSQRPSMPSVKNSVSPSGLPSIRTASMHSPTRLATISGSMSTSSAPQPKVLTAQPLPTGS